MRGEEEGGRGEGGGMGEEDKEEGRRTARGEDGEGTEVDG